MELVCIPEMVWEKYASMKIVLVNYRYFISGGPERYYFNIKEILENNGHIVVPFSIKNNRNFPTEYEEYFLNAVGDDNVYFAQMKKTIKTIIKSFFRMFYSFEAKRKFKKLLHNTQPDLVYIMHYHNKISPSIIDVAKKCKIPVVHRISDFQYICPNALLYSDNKGICEDCLNGKYFNCIRYKCVFNSYIYSGLKLFAKVLSELLGITKKIDAFVVPSSFTLNKLNQYGIPLSKLHHIPTFFNVKDSVIDIRYEPYMLFIGRIEKEKGLMTLIKAFENTSYNLKIIGFSNNRYEDELKTYLQNKQHNIEFLGRMEFNEIIPYFSSCLCTVVPSECYDNFPNVILESFAYQKAVIATNIGSLPELVRNNETGLTFEYTSADSLRVKIEYIFNNQSEAQRMGENAYQILMNDYSPEKHYSTLLELFHSLVNSDGLFRNSIPIVF